MNLPKKLRKSNHPNFFHHLDPLTILVLLSLGGLTLGLIAAVTWHLVHRNQVNHLTLVAGNRDGESYILSQAIEKVVETNNPKIKIDVQETGGTTENIQLLEEGKAQLATAQADVPTGSSARVVAVLYRDTFQLVVKQKPAINPLLGAKGKPTAVPQKPGINPLVDAKGKPTAVLQKPGINRLVDAKNKPIAVLQKPEINHFSDLKGKRIGLPQSGGQFRSFLQVANHYGLKKEDFQFIGVNDEDADQAFRQNRVDAVFRVRALGNKSILNLVQKHQGRLLLIEQAAAMKIQYPAFEPTIIPQGAYKGSLPSVPANSLPTVAVQRTLLANEKVDHSIIQEITAILNEHRQEITDAIPKEFDEVKPLVAAISPPSTTSGTGIPTHLGAIAFYERDKPSFIQENADYVGLILTIVLLFGSWVWQLKSWIEQGKKDAADLYIASAIELMKDDDGDPEIRLKELHKIFRQTATDLVEEKISQESFRTFNEAYQTARESIERQIQLLQKDSEKQVKLAEQKQREISAHYVKSVVELLQDRKRDMSLIQYDLDQLLETAAANLIQDNISQESFRTFIEAYKTTRDSIERKKVS